MRQFYGKSTTSDLKQATSGLRNPQLLILMTGADRFEEHVKQLEELYPGVPSIGCIGMSYDSSKVNEQGVAVIAFTDGVEAVANVIENVSDMPVKYIGRLEEDIKKIRPGREDTVCIDLCSGNDACVLTTIFGSLKKNNICLMGGTGDQGKVSVNGKIYPNADAYALVKNLGGKVKVYKENIYRPVEGTRFVASKTDRAKYYVGELNGRPAKQVYMEKCGIKESEFASQTFKNPLGKFNGKDICIISIKGASGSGFNCYRQVNDSDVLTLLQLKDINEIVEETMEQIHRDFSHPSAVFSINCAFRHLLFTEKGIMNHYLDTMSKLGNHCGYVGYGEHYNNQFVNQSMTCVVFQ